MKRGKKRVSRRSVPAQRLADRRYAPKVIRNKKKDRAPEPDL
jgi:hypothetical protein